MGTANASLFHARNIPTISIESYLLRILKYCPTTNEVFLSLLIYFDRMSKSAHNAHDDADEAGTRRGPGIIIDSYNLHRFVITGITVASKFFSDVFYLNSRYAKVCCSFFLRKFSLSALLLCSLAMSSLFTYSILPRLPCEKRS